VEFAASDLSKESAYKLLIGSVVPRPIAWISTLSRFGKVNLAPFSAFTFLSSRPPMIGVSIGRRDGALKDTAKNILRDGEFVVNIADMALIKPLHRSSFPYEEHESEVDQLDLATLESRDIRPPRVADAPINLECTLHQALEFGSDRAQLFVGEVQRFHVRDPLCVDGKVDSFALDPVARLGGPHYASLGGKVTFGLRGALASDEES
jgi:flavin reductase (DIM6/NTAB) family NADH-FMN oxidoreductase RutF